MVRTNSSTLRSFGIILETKVGCLISFAMTCILTLILADKGHAQEARNPSQEVGLLRYLHGIGHAKQAIDAGDPWIAEKHLQALDPKLRGWEWNVLARQTRAELKFLTWDYSQGVIYGQNRFLDVTFLPGNSKVATRRISLAGNELCVWDIESGKLISQVSCQETPLLDISGDGRFCAMATERSQLRVTIRDVLSGEIRSVIPELGGSIGHLRFSPDGRRIAIVIQANTEGALVWWGVEDEKVLWQSAEPVSNNPLIAFDHDGNRIATASPINGRISIWDTITGQKIQDLGSSQGLRALLFHPK